MNRHFSEGTLPRVRTVLVGIALMSPLFMADACPSKEPGTPSPIAISREFLWVGSKQWLALQDIFGQTLTTASSATIAPDRYVRQCRNKFSEADWASIPDALGELHNKLASNAAGAAPDARAKQWIVIPSTTSGTNIGLTETAASIAVTSTGKLTKNVEIGGKIGAEISSVDLILANIEQKVVLAPYAEDCLRAVLCEKSKGEGGSYASAFIYGDLVRLTLKSGSFDVSAGGSSNTLNLTLKSEIDLKKVDITAAVLGKIDTVEELKTKIAEVKAQSTSPAEYDVPSILEDVRAGRVLRIGNRLRSLSEGQAVIAVESKQVSATECTAYAAQPEVPSTMPDAGVTPD